jgi:hypothetical protein
MTAPILERMGAIIDPAAFAEGITADTITPQIAALREIALAKAEAILGLQYSYEDLPPDLQQSADVLESLMDAAEGRYQLPEALVARDGQPVYSGLFKPLPDGALMVLVPIDPGDEDTSWLVETMVGGEARSYAAQIEVAMANGGTC